MNLAVGSGDQEVVGEAQHVRAGDTGTLPLPLRHNGDWLRFPPREAAKGGNRCLYPLCPSMASAALPAPEQGNKG